MSGSIMAHQLHWLVACGDDSQVIGTSGPGHLDSMGFESPTSRKYLAAFNWLTSFFVSLERKLRCELYTYI
jgi:uncharacterized protein CbrC (UPF0167 family)